MIQMQTADGIENERVYEGMTKAIASRCGAISGNRAAHFAINRRLNDLNPTNLVWKTKLSELRDSLKQHIEREVNELFVKAEELLGQDRLQALARQMDEVEQSRSAVATAKRK